MESSFHIKSLKSTLNYKNDNVVYRFTELFNLSKEQANELFQDCIIWLWLCANAAKDRKQGISSPAKMAIDNSVLIIDEMWHNFICFTKDYQVFCSKYFGVFIHHTPTTKAFNDELKSNYEKNIEFQKDRRNIQYEYMGSKLETELGEKIGTLVFTKWYVDYPKKYSKAKIKTLRKR